VIDSRRARLRHGSSSRIGKRDLYRPQSPPLQKGADVAQRRRGDLRGQRELWSRKPKPAVRRASGGRKADPSPAARGD
jgi:hypothetical protein